MPLLSGIVIGLGAFLPTVRGLRIVRGLGRLGNLGGFTHLGSFRRLGNFGCCVSFWSRINIAVRFTVDSMLMVFGFVSALKRFGFGADHAFGNRHGRDIVTWCGFQSMPVHLLLQFTQFFAHRNM